MATQLDFVDLNLLPALEFEVRTKLHNLLRDTINLAINIFEQKAAILSRILSPSFPFAVSAHCRKGFSRSSSPGRLAYRRPQACREDR